MPHRRVFYVDTLATAPVRVSLLNYRLAARVEPLLLMQPIWRVDVAYASGLLMLLSAAICCYYPACYQTPHAPVTHWGLMSTCGDLELSVSVLQEEVGL